MKNCGGDNYKNPNHQNLFQDRFNFLSLSQSTIPNNVNTSTTNPLIIIVNVESLSTSTPILLHRLLNHHNL